MVGRVLGVMEGKTEAIPYTVITTDQKTKVLSDEQGWFRVQDLPLGCHRLDIKAIGFPGTSRPVLVLPDRTDTLRINLGPSYPPKY